MLWLSFTSVGKILAGSSASSRARGAPGWLCTREYRPSRNELWAVTMYATTMYSQSLPSSSSAVSGGGEGRGGEGRGGERRGEV